MKHRLGGGAIHAPPAELAQSVPRVGWLHSGHSRVKLAYGASAKDLRDGTVSTPRQAERTESNGADVV
jgi:hypothetical protein